MPAQSSPRPLRDRLLLAQATAIVLLGGGVLTVSLWGARRAVQSVSGALVDRTAIEVVGHLERLYEPAAQGLSALGALAAEGRLRPEGSEAELRRLALPWLEARAGVGAFGVFGDDGRGLALRRAADGWQAVVVRPEAAPIEAGPGAASGLDPRREPWWPGAPAAGDAESLHWAARAGGGLAGRSGFAVARRVVTGAGEGRIVVVELLLDSLLAHLAALETTPGTVVGVLDAERRLVAWSGRVGGEGGARSEDLFLRTPRELGVTLFDDGRSALEAASPEAAKEPLRFSSGGEAWWGRIRPFALPGGGEQSVAVLVPARDLLDDRTRLLWTVLGLTAVALVVALASSVALARRVAAPIETLVARSERIAAGELEPEPPVESEIAEVERLARAQESMRAGLKTLLKLERDLQIARQIQQSTWPRELPQLPGLELAASAHPADETGGDGYDVVAVPGEPAGRSFLFLADATGHGIGPALSVTQLRSMLRMAVRSGHDLGELVEPVNQQLHADLPRNRFITAWFGRLDADGGGLDSLSAGQAPLVHYHAAEDRLEVLKADLPPLGLFPMLPPARPRRIELAPGDLWVVLSDGFYEAADPEGEELGVERIGEVLRRCRARPAGELLAELRAELERFTRGAPAADDQTALLLKRTG